MKKKLDAAKILEELAEIRKKTPRPSKDIRPQAPATRSFMPSGTSSNVTEEFEMEAIADALGTIAAEVRAAIEEKQSALLEKALEAFYVAEELAKDPAHADLIPHVEEMRRAYERDFGRPIPPKKK